MKKPDIHSPHWNEMRSAPRDGSKIHIKMEPSDGIFSDKFVIPNCWFENGSWVHEHRGGVERIRNEWMTGWAHYSLPLDGEEIYVDWLEAKSASMN